MAPEAKHVGLDWERLLHHGTIELGGASGLEGFTDDIGNPDSNYPGPVITLAFEAAPIGSVATGAGAASSSGLSQAITQDTNGSGGFVILASYDASINSLATSNPTLYANVTGAINSAVSFYESEFTNPITIQIDFGFGEVAGGTLSSSALAESVAAGISPTSAPSYTALANDLAAKDPSDRSSLPANDPTNGGVWDPTEAEAIALGILHTSSGFGGWVGLSSTQALNYSSSNRAVGGKYDAIGALEHEISEVLGRIEILGTRFTTISGTAYALYSPLDLFRFSTANSHTVSPGSGYFSLNNGSTDLANFNNPSNGGDAGDWASSVINDSYDAFSSSGVANTISAIDLSEMNALGYTLNSAACYVAGSHILTEHGEKCIEELIIGEPVVTRFNGVVPVRWIGHRRIDCGRHAEARLIWPIRVTAGAFAPERPHRDLLLSPDHAVAVDDCLVPIRLLLNGASIRQEQLPEVHYFHVELDRHDVLFAEGLPAESYLETGNRGMFSNADVPCVLHPQLADVDPQHRREALACLPFPCGDDFVRRVWERLAARAEALGYMLPVVVTTPEPRLEISADGRRYKPVWRDAGRYSFMLPAASEIRLHSRSVAPATVRPWLDDRRILGVMLRRMRLSLGACDAELALDDPRLTRGWWPLERHAHNMWRWTDGAAALPALDVPAMLDLELGDTLSYPCDETGEAALSGSGQLHAA